MEMYDVLLLFIYKNINPTSNFSINLSTNAKINGSRYS